MLKKLYIYLITISSVFVSCNNEKKDEAPSGPVYVTSGLQLEVTKLEVYDELFIDKKGPNKKVQDQVIEILEKWYSPKNISELNSVFKEDAVTDKMKEDFLSSIQNRDKSEQIEVIAKLDFKMKDKAYSFVKIYKRIKGQLVESRIVNINRSNSTVVYKDHIDVLGLKNMFWRLKPKGLSFFLSLDDILLVGLDSALIGKLKKLKNKILNNGSIDIRDFYELEKTLKYSTKDIEIQAYKTLFVQPIDARKEKSLNNNQILAIKEKFPVLNNEELNKLKSLIGKSLIFESAKFVQLRMQIGTKQCVNIIKEIIALGNE